MSRRSVHLRAVPGGQMQFVRQLMDMSSIGRVGFYVEKTTLSFFTRRLRISWRITFARGYIVVL